MVILATKLAIKFVKHIFFPVGMKLNIISDAIGVAIKLTVCIGYAISSSIDVIIENETDIS